MSDAEVDLPDDEKERGMLAVLKKANLSQADIDRILLSYRTRRAQVKAMQEAKAIYFPEGL